MSPRIADAELRQELASEEAAARRSSPEASERSWRELLQDVPALELVADHPRPARRAPTPRRRLGEPWLDDPALVEELARRAGTSLAVVALAAFQVQLARASRQPDFALAATVTEMTTEGAAASPLFLRTRLAGAPSFLEWLGQVDQAWRRARRLGPPTEEEWEDVQAQAAFAFHDISAATDGEAGAGSFDLALTVEDTAQGWILHLEYDAGLFDETTAHRWLARYRTLLSTVCRRPEESIWRLPLLPEAEARRLLAWNSGGGAMAWETLHREPLHQGFERWAGRAPEAPAVSYWSREGEYETVSYGKLNARANRLAHRLRQLGVGPEVPVALLLERGVEMVTAILAVLKAGGAYVPLDPVYPPARLAFVVQDSGAALVLTEGSLAGRLPPEDETGAPEVPRLIWQDLVREEGWASLPATDPPPAASVDSLAYIIYTSGSTGQPKGVLIPHSHPVDLLAGTEGWFRFGAGDVWSLFHSFAFDVSVWELWGAFLYGARLVVAPYEVTRSPRDFHRLLRQERVSILSQTPSAFLALLRAEQEVAAAGEELDPGWALRAVAFAGEALEVRALAPWVEAYGDAAPELINLYGITETTVHGTYRRLLRQDVEAAAAGRDPGVGVMIPDQSLRILETRLADPPDPVAGLAPIGIPGELCVGGGRIARGYLGRPRLTAQRFVPDPFSEIPGARLYRSGDLARYREDGSVQYLGRIDHQIKLRGFRIEAGEVEAALLEHPAVSAAVVMVRTDADSAAGQATRSSDETARLVAYLVVAETAPPSVAAEARELARKKLPEYMVPAAYVRLAELPLTANSKVDRRRLPAPGVADLVRGEAEPPRSGTEARLAAIWEEVLEVPGVGRRDHFLALGGHSLKATRVLARVRSRLGVVLSFSDLMAHPELARQAARIDELGQAAGASPRLESPTAAEAFDLDDGSAPLSYAQERMWLHQQLHPASNAFNLAFALELEGELVVERLAAALGRIEERHQALRTRFVEVDGSPRAVVAEPRQVLGALLSVIDLQSVGAEDLAPELTTAAQARPFCLDGSDLSRERLLRCRLLRRGPRHHVLLLVVHHIACDGWSLGPFVQELSALYGKGEAKLPELPLQYADFARWQRRWLESPAAAEQLRGWREEGLTAPGAGERLAPDLPGTEHPVRLVSRQLDAGLVAELEALARRRGTTLFTVLTAALYALLHRATGAPALTLGTLVAGRTQEAVEPLVGCFINTLPLRCQVTPGESFETLLGRARGVAETAYDRQDLPFEKLVQELGAAGAADGQALFQVLVAYQSMPLEELELSGLDWLLLETPAGQRSAAFDFVFFFRRQGETLSLVLEVDGGRFTTATGEALAQDLAAMLAAVARDETTAVADLPLPSGRFPREPAKARGVASSEPADQALDQEPNEEPDREQVRRKVASRQAELSQRKAGLSQAKRALLARKLKRKGGAAGAAKPQAGAASKSPSSGSGPSTASQAVASIPRRPADAPPAPLSFTQERLWFLQKLEPASSAYNLVDAFRLDGAIRVGLLERALTAVVERQQVLRSSFEEGSGLAKGPIQRVLPSRPVPLPVLDLGRLGPEAGRREGDELVAREGRRPFDLSRGEPLRAFLLRWGPQEHGLVFDMHHVVADAWAFYLLMRELTRIYRALGAGESDGLAPLAVQYADYAAWQRRELAGERLEREIRWWRGHLEGAPDLLELPADRPRPALRSGRGGTVTAILSGELAAGLRRLAQERQATLFMTLLAGFEALVHRLTGARDFLLGSPATFRDRVELESLVGVFVNTLVLRADLGGDPAFGELVRRVRGEALEAFSHQSLPFEKLVEELRPARDLSHPPLVQVVFVLENTPRSAVRLPGLEIEPLHAAAGTAKFDLTFTVREAPDRLYLAVEHNRDLFDDATAEALVGWYRRLLTAAVADPETPVSRLPLLDEAARDQMLELDPQRALAASEGLPQTLGEAFLRQARRDPEAPALTYGDVTLSYGELAARSGALARRIVAELKTLAEEDSSRGTAEARVGLCLERGVELVVALLAIVRAGAAYVPLDPSYPTRRLRWIVADAGVGLVVSDSAAGEALSGAWDGAGVDPDGVEEDAGAEAPSPRWLLVDDGEAHEETAEEPAEDGLAPVEGALPAYPESLAYVIYTSGSTGEPKGVLVPQDRVLRLFRATAEDFRFGAEDVWTLFHSSSFDFSVWELWGALLHGGRLVVVPYELSRSPEAFHRLLREEGVTVLNQTPSAFQSLVRADGEVAEEERRELCLRWVIFGGEALDGEILQPWWRRRSEGQGPRLVNMYGITETTVHVTHQPLARGSSKDPGIGRALRDLSLRVLDPRGEPQPAGVPGEICVGGAGVARGYLGRPALTAARFVPDPWSPSSGGRLYRSGDRARYRRDGSLEYLGRLDQQVKVRGFRIEVGEIEASLTALPWIAAAAVTVRPADPGGPRLAAYLVPAGEEDDDLAARSREALRSRLPEHMVPAAWAVLESLPLTVNGKVDRRRLPAPEAAVAPSASVAPRDELETAIAEIWADVLALSQVGVEDSFFDLGGHSLLLVEVHGRLRQELEGAEDLAMLDLFRYPTVASLAAHLAAGSSSESPDDDNDGSAAVAQRYSRAEQRKQSLRRRGRNRSQRRRSGHGDGERNDP